MVYIAISITGCLKGRPKRSPDAPVQNCHSSKYDIEDSTTNYTRPGFRTLESEKIRGPGRSDILLQSLSGAKRSRLKLDQGCGYRELFKSQCLKLTTLYQHHTWVPSEQAIYITSLIIPTLKCSRNLLIPWWYISWTNKMKRIRSVETERRASHIKIISIRGSLSICKWNIDFIALYMRKFFKQYLHAYNS